jgi:predicted dehydrogenase
MYLSKYSGAFELVHDLDLAIWYANQKVDNVYGVYGPFSDYEFESPDTIELLLSFENKCVATVHLDFFQTPRRRIMELIGVGGVITIEFSTWDEAIIRSYKKSEGKWNEIRMKTERNDMFIDEDCEFLDLAMQNKPMKCNIDEASKSLLAIEKDYKPY